MTDARAAVPSRPWGTRRYLLLGLLLAGVLAWLLLGLRGQDLALRPGGGLQAEKFFSAALRPAWDYEEAPLVAHRPFLEKVGRGLLTTLQYAVCAVSLSIVFGFLLGFLGSSVWWAGEQIGAESPWRRWLRRGVGPVVYVVTRFVMTLGRSIHELIWALLFLAAFGLTPFSAVLAICIPYTGTFAKIFSEMIDEVPRDTQQSLRACGASPLQIWFFGQLPRAWPDLFSYMLYRLECGLRSTAVLGFMGVETIGLYLQQSFDNSNYREAWTYLYALLALIVCFDVWSGAVRQRHHGRERS